MEVLTCEAARAQLAPYHDRELPVAAQIAMEAHLAWCPECAAEARALAALGEALRAAAADRLAGAPDLDALDAAIVSRLAAERAQSLGARLGRLFDDLHLLWAGVTAAAASLACVAVIAGLVSLASPERADSLWALLTALASPGSNANPVRPDERVRLPRVDPQAVAPAMLLAPAPRDDELLLALAAVVTREGRVADLELLGATDHDARLLHGVLNAAAAARFEPARIDGTPVAVSMVWVVSHTTVRGRTHG